MPFWTYGDRRTEGDGGRLSHACMQHAHVSSDVVGIQPCESGGEKRNGESGSFRTVSQRQMGGLRHRFLVMILVMACRIVIPAFSISLRDSPVVRQTFNAGAGT